MLIEERYNQLIEKLEKEVEDIDFRMNEIIDATDRYNQSAAERYTQSTMKRYVHPIGCSIRRIKKILEESKEDIKSSLHPVVKNKVPIFTQEQLEKINELLKD